MEKKPQLYYNINHKPHAGGRNAADKELMNEIEEFLEKTTHIISGDHGFVKTLTYYRDQGSLITVMMRKEIG